MNPQVLYSQQQRGWILQPDQSGYRPHLPRSGRLIDLSLPPRRLATPTPHNVDPQNCHRSLREHRHAIKQRYRRMVRGQMKDEESLWGYQHQQDLEQFPYGTFETTQPLLPALNRAMHQSGGDATRAWQIFDRRSWEEKAADEAADEKREAEVRKRADEMIRKDKEAKEDEAMRELLEELPTFNFPDIHNTITFASVLRKIQELIPARISDITISPRGYPNIQLGLSQVLSWVRQHCSQENLDNVFLVSIDELDRHCTLVADRIFHHLSVDFKKKDYLRQLRNTQARLRKLTQSNSELRVENERLKSGADLFNCQLEQRVVGVPYFKPSIRLHYAHPSQSRKLNSGIAISDNEVEHNRGRVPIFEPAVHQHYSHPPQPQRPEYYPPQSHTPGFEQTQINRERQRSTSTPLNGPSMTAGYQNNTIAQNGGISQMDHIMEHSPRGMKEIRHETHDARRAQSMPPQSRGRARDRNLHTPLPEFDPVAGCGTVVAVDEIGPIYDYSNLAMVSMRGGAGPYSLLEDSDSEGDNKSDGKAPAPLFSNVTPSLGKGTLNRIKRFVDDDDEDDDSFSNHSSLKFTKHGDTRTNDPNNKLWESGPPSSSGMGKPSGVVDTTHGRRNDWHHGRRRRNRASNIAPGLARFKPKVDPYAEVPHGFQFSWTQAENVPLSKTWTTLDPKTGTVKYEEGSEEAQEGNPQEAYMWNPSDARNTPLAATLGYSNVVFAAEAKQTVAPEVGGLTATSLKRLDRQLRRNNRADSIDDFIDVTSTPGSPNAPLSQPSVIEFHPTLAQGGKVTITDETIDEQSSCIDADVRENFIDNINAMHDVRATPGVFERRNQGWVAQTKAPVSYINDFGDGNVVEVKIKTEMRTRMMNERGEYDGKDLGQVKKRYRRGFSEMIQARDAEMVRATKEYREWQAMSLEDRMERLTLIRQPIDLWKGKPGADQDDQHDLKYLPKFYERRVSRRKEKQRMRASLADRAKEKENDTASTSLGTAGTGDNLDTFGVLGDCDELPVMGTSSGSQTPKVGNESLQEMLQRALDASPPRNSRSRSRTSSKSGSAPGSAVVEPRLRLPYRAHNGRRPRPSPSLYSRDSGTGNSVAGPRQSRPSSSHPSPSPAAWCFSETSSDSQSTVRGLRNAPLGDQIFSGTDRSSNASNVTNELTDLIAAYDDSPTLRIPTDIDIPSALVTKGKIELHSYAAKNMEERGRVVTVRLHAVEESHVTGGAVLPKFTPGAIADRVFGGVVQEFQLHPAKRTAVVIFMHPREARSFVHHVRNVRKNGTEHDIRELQIEASWFRGAESLAILPAQQNLLKHSIASASRCILLHHIPKEKSNSVVSEELAAGFDTILVRTSLITPQQNYILQSEGKQALIEFANLQDAIRAYEDLKADLIVGYEDANPRFTNERTEKRPSTKEYCGCLGCFEKREAKSNEMEEKKRKLDEQMGEEDGETSYYSDTASD